jgi:hypothetical protein
VYKTLQDQQGFMWFLTDKGMVKFDGHTFKTFTTKNDLPNNDVWEAFSTPDNKLWYLSKSSALGYIENDSVYNFPNAKKGETMNPIFSSQIGNFVFPTGSNKTFQLVENKWETILNTKWYQKDGYLKVFHPKIDALITYQEKDSLLVINHDSTIVKRHYLTKNITTSGKRGQVSESLFYWANDEDIMLYNLNTLEIIYINLFDETGIKKSEHIRLNYIDGKIQVTGRGFVGFINKDYHIEDVFYFPNEIESHFGYVDRSKTLWLSTFSDGVYKLPYAKRKINYHLPKDKIQSLNWVNNTLVAGVFNKGFFLYDFKQGEFNELISSKQYIYETFEIPELNTVFYSGESQVYTQKLDQSSINYHQIHPEDGLRSTQFFKDKLYSIFSFGIHEFDQKTLEVKQKIYHKGCKDLLIFNNRLLVAGAFGIKEFKDDSIVDIDHFDFQKPILNIKSIGDSLILINTDGFGAYLSNLHSITPLKGSEFLSVEDAFIEHSTIWLATNAGVLKYQNHKDEYRLERTFTIEDGLPTNNINCLFVNDEQLIIGSNDGLAILPKHEKNKSLLMDVYIKNMAYNEQSITESDEKFVFKKNNVLNVSLGNIDFSDHKIPFEYTYKLEPLNQDWVSVKSDVFSFSNLAPDEYTFKLKTKTGEVSQSFMVTPLFWQTTWFRLLASLLFVLILILGIRQYFKISKEKQLKVISQKRQFSDLQLKALRSQMNPHFVFNALSAIQFYINSNDFETSETYLVKFSRLIRQYFELSKEQEISLETEIRLLTDYLDLEKLRFKEKLSFNIHVDQDLNPTQMTIPTMLLQPIVENAVNHGIFNKIDNGQVEISFEYENQNTFRVTISDDGVGIKNTLKNENNGVNSSKVRTERILFLNQSGKWNIDYQEQELHPNHKDKGHLSQFIISRITSKPQG